MRYEKMGNLGRFLRRFVFGLMVLLIPSLSFADMTSYCAIPPLLSSVKPNLLLMVDNSASQYDLTYINSDPTKYCFDNTYNNSSTYVGYFDTTTNYTYNTADVSLSNTGKFTSGAAMPGSCTYGGSSSATPYVCVNMSGTAPTRSVTQFVASGNFLNWLSVSKLDVQKLILTGGKYDTTNSILTGQSRGCNGSRFIKVVPAINAITFVSRGPNSTESGYSQSTQGGDTRIEIYDSATPYDSTDCLAAVNDWMTGANLGQTQTDTRNCIGAGAGLKGQQIAELNHIIHNCYWYFQGHAMTNDNPLQGECASLYSTYYANNPASMTDDTAGDAICSSALSHPVFTGITQAGYITNDKGYLGRCACYVGVTHGHSTTYSWNWDSACFPASGGVGDIVAPCSADIPNSCAQCTINEQIDFCQGITSSPATDPSTPIITGTTLNVPGFVMDSGLTNMFRSGTFYAKVSLATPPTGVIDEFKNLINFGAMVFNYDGSSSECGVSGSNINCPRNCSSTTTQQCYLDKDCPTGQTCVASANLDGGKILSYISSSVGSHAAAGTLINSIDAVNATSWTPYAEAFYNAIGYFARTNDYTVSPGTSRTDLRINTADFAANNNPSQYRCQANNILIISDGMSTADRNATVNSLVTLYNDGDGKIGWATCSAECQQFAGSMNLDDLAWLARHRNIKTFSTSSASTTAPVEASESITTYVIYTGAACSPKDAQGNCTTTDESVAEKLMQETALQGGGTYQIVTDPSQLRSKLRDTLLAVSAKASSGTAASVLASGEGSGANLAQAVYYPTTPLISNGGAFSSGVSWIGRLANYWYYVDPYFTTSTIMEDTAQDAYLNLSNDMGITLRYDATLKRTVADLYTYGSATPSTTGVALESVKSLWEAGLMLWNRDITATPRTIYTTTDGATLTSFTTGNAAALLPYFNLSLSANGDLNHDGSITSLDAGILIRYINGEDFPTADLPSINWLRSRTTAIDLNANGTTTDTVTINGVSVSEAAKVWKLGDIIDSTPRISAWPQLNYFDTVYYDTTYASYFKSSNYTGRGMIFTGANDGMLHAFNLGKLELPNPPSYITNTCTFSSSNLKACMSGTTANFGKEMWAFIPKNALPYLQYQADPTYCHLYSVDLSPFMFDASIGGAATASKPSDGSSWKTVLIEGMGFGGACRNNGTACNSKACSVTTGTSCTVDADCPANETCLSNCVNTPAANNGYSSYFALDVTTQSSPSLLWEFSSPDLGFTTTGPTVVRINAAGDTNGLTKNGYWYAVFGSGPTGPIDASTKQFLGRSDQNLKLFVVDLRTGALVRTIDTGINNAFAGSMITGTMDPNKNYSDDVLYVPYVKKAGDGTWTSGGVGRLVTKEDSDPNNWVWSTVADNIGPVSSAVAKLVGNGQLWLYFAEGRYFFDQLTSIDDPTGQRWLYGLQDPCYSSAGFDSACTASAGGATEITDAAAVAASCSVQNWKIRLAPADATYYAEREITDPQSTVSGVVYFTTFTPNKDICAKTGNTVLWAVKNDTGCAVTPAGALKGKAIIQLSTGEIKQVDLSTALTARGGRATAAMVGNPPYAKGPSIISQPQPVDKVLHIKER